MASSPSRSTSSDTQTASIPKSSTSSVASSSGYHVSSTDTARTPSAGSPTSSIATPSSYSSGVRTRSYPESQASSTFISSTHSVPSSSVETTRPANSSTTKVTPTTTASGSSSTYGRSTHIQNTSYTTSTVYSTTVRVVTPCAPEHTECANGPHTTTETIAVSTTVCPMTETTLAAANGSVAPGPPQSYAATSYTTSTVYATTIRTVGRCASGAGDSPTKPTITTETLAVSTIICPISHGIPGGFTTYARPSVAHQPSDESGSSSTPAPEASAPLGTQPAQPELPRPEESVSEYTTSTISTAASAPAANSATAGPVQITNAAPGVDCGIGLAAVAVVLALCNS